MKVDSNILTHFLNKCSIKTHGFSNKSITAMPDMLLVVEGNQMKMEGLSPAGNLQVEFYETLSEEFEDEQFPIVDTVLFHKLVNSEMDGEIEMVMDGNNIVLKSEKVRLNFPTIDTVETMSKYPEAANKIKENGYGRVEYNTTVSITATELVNAIGNSGSTYNSYVCEFEVVNGKFSIGIKTDDRGAVIKTPTATVDGVDCSAKYATGIDSVFKGFLGEVKLQLNQDTPMLATDEVGNLAVFFPLDS